MSTLKTHNLQSADSGSVNIALTANAGMIVTGISTFNNRIDIGSLGVTTNFTVAGLSTFSDDVRVIDDKKLMVGNSGSDLYLKHISSSNYSQIAAAIPLYIQSNDLRLKDFTNGDDYIRAVRDGSVQLYYNNAKKIETTNTGAIVTGVLTATSFSGSGANLTNLPPSAPVGGASTNQVFFENDKLVEVNYQITSTKNAMTAGPISVSAGIAVTVPSGCSWTIV